MEFSTIDTVTDKKNENDDMVGSYSFKRFFLGAMIGYSVSLFLVYIIEHYFLKII